MIGSPARLMTLPVRCVMSPLAGVSGTDLVVDTNGYYADTAANQSSTFKVVSSGT